VDDNDDYRVLEILYHLIILPVIVSLRVSGFSSFFLLHLRYLIVELKISTVYDFT